MAVPTVGVATSAGADADSAVRGGMVTIGVPLPEASPRPPRQLSSPDVYRTTPYEYLLKLKGFRVLLLTIAITHASGAFCPSGPCEVIVGAVRVQALSPTLVRVERKGPLGFEGRSTFMVVNRTFTGVRTSARVTAAGTNITTAGGHYSVLVRHDGSCLVRGGEGQQVFDSAVNSSRTSTSNLLHWPSPLTAAAYAIEDRPRFVPPAWAPAPAPHGAALQNTSGYDFRNNVEGDVYIFLLGSSLDTWWASRAEFLHLTGPTPLLPDYAYGTWFTRWHQYTELAVKTEIGRWDAGQFPLDVWGLDMNWRRTNGTVVGAPVCHSQVSTVATCEDHKYLVNTTEFPTHPHTAPLQSWLEWMQGRGLHTYLNDHPFPRARATTPVEAAFRWQSLAAFLSRGLSFWWFDHGWIFTIPPPFVPVNDTSSFGKFPGPWEGLTSEVWGSHLYYDTMKRFAATGTHGDRRPLALSRNGGTNWRPGMPNTDVNGVPAHHRYPVWWNGDGVPLMGSVSSMVDEAVHDLRPFVHSDCGGGETNATAVLRWTAHCVLGTILRFHGADHAPWLFDNATQAVMRRYLQMRYALAPSLVAAGRATQRHGLPLAARCDLFWPGHHHARSNTQYISTYADALVAPLNETETSRAVWIPPGDWEDAWDGGSVTGPRTLHVTKDWDQIPMWHRRGGLVVTTDSKALRIAAQDWARLTVDAWPHAQGGVASSVSRDVYAGGTRMAVGLRSDGRGGICVYGTALAADAGAGNAGSDSNHSVRGNHSNQRNRSTHSNGGGATDATAVSAAPRTWLLRLHLAVGYRLSGASVDGAAITLPVVRLDPAKDCAGHFPFGGKGATPACKAGAIAEIELGAVTHWGWKFEATLLAAG